MSRTFFKKSHFKKSFVCAYLKESSFSKFSLCDAHWRLKAWLVLIYLFYFLRKLFGNIPHKCLLLSSFASISLAGLVIQDQIGVNSLFCQPQQGILILWPKQYSFSTPFIDIEYYIKQERRRNLHHQSCVLSKRVMEGCRKTNVKGKFEVKTKGKTLEFWCWEVTATLGYGSGSICIWTKIFDGEGISHVIVWTKCVLDSRTNHYIL